MSRPKVLITHHSVPKIAFDLLKQTCELIVVNSTSRKELLEKAKGVDAIFWAARSTPSRLDKELLDTAGSQMKTIGTLSSGLNHIDLTEVKKRGIRLGSTSAVGADAVANVALLLALAASRRLHEGRLQIEQGKWKSHDDCDWMVGQDIAGSTVGIIGLGQIGQAIVKMLKPLDVARFIYTGRKEKAEGKELNATFVNLDTLAKESDFVFVSCALTEETQGICNADFFSKMKNTAVFVNTSRGPTMDQDALIKALKEGRIFGAGLDVMVPEPLPTSHELLKLSNVVVLPHIGSATVKNRDTMAKTTALNILKGLNGEEMPSPVNIN